MSAEFREGNPTLKRWLVLAGWAIASYVRMGEPYPMMVPLTTCLLLRAGIYLREERLRWVLPIRRKIAR